MFSIYLPSASKFSDLNKSEGVWLEATFKWHETKKNINSDLCSLQPIMLWTAPNCYFISALNKLAYANTYHIKWDNGKWHWHTSNKWNIRYLEELKNVPSYLLWLPYWGFEIETVICIYKKCKCWCEIHCPPP